MGRRRVSGVPKHMRDGAINAYGGVDRGVMGDLYSSHLKSIREGAETPRTLNTHKDIIDTPRGKADVRAYEEKTATSSLTTKAILERIAIVQKWPYFRVTGNLTLHFYGREWVFLKVLSKGLMISDTLKNKHEALEAQRLGKIWWAGDNL